MRVKLREQRARQRAEALGGGQGALEGRKQAPREERRARALLDQGAPAQAEHRPQGVGGDEQVRSDLLERRVEVLDGAPLLLLEPRHEVPPGGVESIALEGVVHAG
jgi:hypothetical protein